ncbi:MAG: hypothetical protein Q7R96_02245 [Nanoarchaeota archaeon]|nr:hypothetical protein [Nanoarchaeota archaeon]
MKLNVTEKRVLTLLDHTHLDKFYRLATQFINVPERDIKTITKKLQTLSLIRIEPFLDGSWAFHTEKVTKDLLDEKMIITLQTSPKIHFTD